MEAIHSAMSQWRWQVGGGGGGVTTAAKEQHASISWF